MGEADLSEAAKRCSEAVTEALLRDPYGNIGRWIAVSLREGRWDKVVYDTKVDAVTHQLHETWCAYVCLSPNGMPPRHAESYLAACRRLYDSGYRYLPEVDLPLNVRAEQIPRVRDQEKTRRDHHRNTRRPRPR